MDSEHLRSYYDKTFQKTLKSTSGQVECSASLLEWVRSNSPLWQRHGPMFVIELGCGPKSILEELRFSENSQCFGVDFSGIMIDHARSHTSSGVFYECLDALEIDTHPILQGLNFDLVVDGHLFHCLTDERMREKYLSLVMQKLKVKQGFFILECMVETDTLTFADDFLFLEDSRVLLQQIGNEAIPVRYIPRAETVIEQIEKNGFKIIKFLCPPGWKIISDARRVEPIQGDPGLARFLLTPLL
ncbi:MAG: class I SAM-dependent methyltransferase [Bdellovibrio sp.]|nr:class I SAM-dependent methyltransferase [Bdellovibrio sp.]